MPSDDDTMRHEAAERLRAMAPHHRDGVCSILLGVAAWMEYVNNVDDPDDHARAVASARALLGAEDPTTQKTKLDRVHAMLDRLRPHLPADLFGELAAIVYISDRPMTAADIRRGQEVAQLLDNPDAARNPTDPTAATTPSTSPSDSKSDGWPAIGAAIQLVVANDLATGDLPRAAENLVAIAERIAILAGSVAATEPRSHCSCGRALPCRHCTQET